MKQQYTVGQILYVIPDQQVIVYPMQITEEITKRSLVSGEINVEVDYLLYAGGKNPKYTNLSLIKGEIFDSSEAARNILISRATQSINKHIEVAIKKAESWYGAIESSQTVLEDDAVSYSEEDMALVDLGNGVKARVRMANNSL